MSQVSPLLCFRPRPQARVRLVAFPWAGSSAAGLRPLADALFHADPGIELHAVAYAARGHRRHVPLPATLDALADDVVPAILGLAAPVALYGHSFGAVAAFSCAQRMCERRAPPVHLVAAARVAPSVDVRGPLLDDDALVALLAAHGLVDPALFADTEARALLLPPLRRDLRLSEQTLTTDVVEIPLTTLRGLADGSVDPAGVAAWGEHGSKGCRHLTVDGGHLFVRDQAAAVAALLAQVLSP